MLIKNIDKKEEVMEFIRQNKDKLLSFGIKKIGLFGSYVRREQTVNSDLDLLVEFVPDKKSYRNFISLSNFLEDSLNTTVDIVTTESLSPYLGPYILKEVEYIVFSS